MPCTVPAAGVCHACIPCLLQVSVMPCTVPAAVVCHALYSVCCRCLSCPVYGVCCRCLSCPVYGVCCRCLSCPVRYLLQMSVTPCTVPAACIWHTLYGQVSVMPWPLYGPCCRCLSCPVRCLLQVELASTYMHLSIYQCIHKYFECYVFKYFFLFFICIVKGLTIPRSVMF